MASISLAAAMPEVENDAIFKALNLSAAVPPPPPRNMAQEDAYGAEAMLAGMYPTYDASLQLYGQWDYSWSDYDYGWYSTMSQQMEAVAQASMLIQAASAQVSSNSAGSVSLPEMLPESGTSNKGVDASNTAATEKVETSASGDDAAKDSEKDAQTVAASPSGQSKTESTVTPFVLTTPCRKTVDAADDLDIADLDGCDVADAVTWFQTLASHAPVGSPPSLESSPGSIGFADFWPTMTPLSLDPLVPPLPQGPPVILKLSEIVENDTASKSSARDAEAAAILQLVQGGPGVAQGAEILRKLKGGHDTPSTVASDGDGSGAGKALLRQLTSGTQACSGVSDKPTRNGRRGGQRRRKYGASIGQDEDEAEEFHEAPQKPPSSLREGTPRWKPRAFANADLVTPPTPARRAKNGERRNLSMQ